VPGTGFEPRKILSRRRREAIKRGRPAICVCIIWNDVRTYLTSRIDPQRKNQPHYFYFLLQTRGGQKMSWYNRSKEVIIESPFVSTKRMRNLRPIFEKLINRGVKVFVFTRDPWQKLIVERK